MSIYPLSTKIVLIKCPNEFQMLPHNRNCNKFYGRLTQIKLNDGFKSKMQIETVIFHHVYKM